MKKMKHFQRALCAALLALVCSSPLQAQTLTLTSANYTTYLEEHTTQSTGKGWRAKNTDYMKTVKKLIFDASVPRIRFHDISSNGRLRNLEELVLNDYKYNEIRLNGTRLRKVIIQNSSSNTDPIYISFDNSFLSQDSIISDRKFNGLQLKRTKVTDLECIYPMLDLTAYNPYGRACLQLNGGKYDRKTYTSVDDGTYNPTNLIREIDMSRIPSQTQIFLIRHNLLTKIENLTQNFEQVEINQNLLWSADLSTVQRTIIGSDIIYPYISPQKPYADLTVVKGAAEDGSGDEVRLYLPEGQSALFDGSRLRNGSVKLLGTAVADQQIFGTTDKYFKLASVAGGVNADLDLYAKHNGFSYHYTACPSFSDDALDGRGQLQKYMVVEVKTYPYIMYIHPATKSGQGVNYYSGTLWLDYDAVVPDSTTVWIATDINEKLITTEGTAEAQAQVSLEKIGDPGDLIPAGTAMYVRSNTQAGLYAFQKAWKHDPKGWDGPDATSQPTDTLWYDKVLTEAQQQELAAKRALIGNRNLLQGSATPTTFANKREALVLGIENQKGTGMIGFWPFNGTELAAHRCYISEATYRRVTGDTESNAKGATFHFVTPDATGINNTKNDNDLNGDDAWYTLDGKRLPGKPTKRNVYIHNGKKEVIL